MNDSNPKCDKAQTLVIARAWAVLLSEHQKDVRMAREILENMPVTLDPRMNQLLTQIFDLRLQADQLKTVLSHHCVKKLEGK